MSDGEVIPVWVSVRYQTREPRVFHFGEWSRDSDFPTHYLVPKEMWKEILEEILEETWEELQEKKDE